MTSQESRSDALLFYKACAASPEAASLLISLLLEPVHSHQGLTHPEKPLQAGLGMRLGRCISLTMQG